MEIAGCFSDGLHKNVHSFTVAVTNILKYKLFTNTRIALKIRWSQGRVGSTPSSGTNFSVLALCLEAIDLLLLDAEPPNRSDGQDIRDGVSGITINH